VSLTTLLITFGVLLAVYAAVLLALVAAGHGTEASALARFVPDCVVLVRRLLGDPRVPVESKVLLGLLVVYLVSPIDLIPDFIPVAGQLDDAIVAALVLRAVLRSGGEALLREHWTGPPRSLELVLSLTFA
jgi:uncharacterized membrane protein YkvA (DUF1232 family)